MSRKPYHEKMREQLLKEFQTLDEDAPKCFGNQPEGGESAWAMGCPECPIMGECSDASHIVRKAIPKSYWVKANERYRVKEACGDIDPNYCKDWRP